MSEQVPAGSPQPYMPPRPVAGPRVPTFFAPPPPPPPKKRHRLRLTFILGGIACILVGAVMVGVPLVSVWLRGSADQQALNSWNSGGSQALAGPVAAGPATHSCGSASSGDYALVSFQSPAKYHYQGVAGDGTWDMLHQRSMVHYASTPAPGQAGNVIIAFHREPNYQYIDQLDVGGIVTVQDRACHTFTYKVTQRWQGLNPNNVTQLVPTSGHELTLITCTPFWVDTQRMVWRAELVP